MDPTASREPVHPINVKHHVKRTMGQRVADAVAARVGSWPFIIIQSALLVLWIVYNAFVVYRVLHHKGFDPFPFILLNLMLSFQAAYTGPVVMMSQNRQSAKDRDMAEHDYRVNQDSFDHLTWQNEQILRLLQAMNQEPSRPAPGSKT
jgi:uncharacterized membrane protein